MVEMMLSDGEEIIKGETIETVKEYEDQEIGEGYTILKMKDADIEIKKDGNIYVPSEIEDDFVGSWKLKEGEVVIEKELVLPEVYFYSADILKALREMKEQEEDILSENEIFDMVLKYEGIIGYTNKIKRWIKEIYGVKL